MCKIEYVEDCYGCGICAAACPLSLINITLSKDGFYKPCIIEKNKCTDCGICKKVCSFLDDNISILDNKVSKGFSAFSNNKKTRYTCSSGGVAFDIASKFISEGGEVAAVRYNIKKHIAEHYLADSIISLEKSKGSKYIQSFTADAITTILKSKSHKKMVIGTPCQIDSLRRLLRLKKKENDFILIDFFCHGVPSINMWNKYIKNVQNNIGKISSVIFRDKKYGWHNSWAMNIKSFTKKNWFSLYTEKDMFYNFFLGNKILNKPCYTCKFRGLESAADIRIGDLWGGKFKNNKEGISAIIAITQTGMNEINSLSNLCTIKSENINVVTEGQMKNGIPIPSERPILLKLLQSNMSLTMINLLIIFPIKVINKIKRILFLNEY